MSTPAPRSAAPKTARKKPGPAGPTKPSRAAAARKAVEAGKAAGQAGPIVGAGTYFKERHTQKKAVRAENREARATARRGEQISRARAKGRAGAVPFLWRDMPRQALLVELVACLVIVWLGTLVAPKGPVNGTTRAMVKSTGLAALFFILAMVSAGGKGAARAAGAFGALVTLAYVFTSSDALDIVRWAAKYWSKSGTGAAVPAPGAAEEGASSTPIVRGPQ